MVHVQSSWFPIVDRNPQTFCNSKYQLVDLFSLLCPALQWDMSVTIAHLKYHSLIMLSLWRAVFTCDEEAFQAATQRVYAGSCLKVLTMPQVLRYADANQLR